MTTPAISGQAAALLAEHESAVVSIVSEAKAHRITDDVSRSVAADLRGALKQAAARVDEARTAIVKPLNDHVRFLNAKFKPLSDALAGAVSVLDAEIIRDRQEREAAAAKEKQRLEDEAAAARKKQEEEAAARARDAAAQAEADAAKAGMTAEDGKELAQLVAQDELAKPREPILQVAPPPQPQKTIAGESGAVATVKKLWDFEVVELVKVARSFPDAIELKRKPILDFLRDVESQGKDVGQIAALVGLRAFKRDLVSG